MDKLERYRQLVCEYLRKYNEHPNHDKNVENQLILDTRGDHYELLRVGWEYHDCVHSCVLHVDIKDGKIWIQEDNTEESIAGWLEESGVPKSDIVLAFHSPFKRKFTEYAVG